MLKYFATALFLLIVMQGARAQEEPLIEVVTEDYPPFQYEEGGEVKGVAAEVVHAVLEEMALETRIEVLPWVRAYRKALEQPNIALFSVARNPQREKRFHWVGPIVPVKVAVWAKRSRNDIAVESVEDLKGHLTGTFRESGAEIYLEDKGFEVGQDLISIYDNERLFEMVTQGRVDFWVSPLQAARKIAERNSLELEEVLEPVLYLDDLSGEGLYLVLNTDTPDHRVKAFNNAFNRVVASGRFETILARHGLSNWFSLNIMP